MSSLYSVRRVLLGVLCLTVGLTMVDDVLAIAQESGSSRQLERVEIEAPQRRPAPRATTAPGSGADYDQFFPSESPLSEDRERPSGTFTGSGIPASTLSLVEAKSQVSLSSESLPAQVSEVTSQDIQQLNVQTYSDLFRRVPAVRANAYGQGEISHNFSMRGFTGGGGTDTAIFIDGVPQNTPSVSGATGKSEISWLTPEVIDRIEVIKGPFSALYGDFALAGVINIITKKSEPAPSLNSYGGSFGEFRVLGVLSRETWTPTPYVADEYYRIDGYRANQQLAKGSLFNKVSMPMLGGVVSLRYNFYRSDWGAPGYLPIAWVRDGLVARRKAVNETDGGNQTRYELVMNYAPACGERGLYVTAYLDNFDAIRFATLPLNQLARGDERTYWGGRVFYNLVFGDVGSLTIGAETRQDSGQTRQYNTDNDRNWISTTYNYDLRLSNWAWLLQGQIKPADSLKIVGGLRWDYFKQEFDNLTRPENSGTGFPQIMSPKIGVVLTPTKNFNIFANIGSGFRSPGNLEVSPYQAGATSNFSLEPAKIDTADVGFNVALFGNLYFAASYYHTIMQREIRTVDNQPVNIGDTLRKGYEAEAKYYPSEDINLFASYGWVDAKVTNPTTAGQILLTGVSEHIIKGGVTVQKEFGEGRRVLADAYYEYSSGPPSYAGKSTTPLFGPDYDVYNFKLMYRGSGWSSHVAARYQPRELSSGYTYLATYGSNRYMSFSPEPKWQFNAGLSYSF